MLQKGRALGGEVPSILGAMGQAYALSGDRGRALELLAELERLATVKYVPSACFAVIHLGLGDKARALDWLEEGCRRRDSQLSGIKMHPVYDPLREEPRFQALMKRLRF
jgi:hypothetical protein